MQFASDPDVAFQRGGRPLAVIEVKGGIDTAAALERYPAARRTFEQVLKINPRCITFLLAAVETKEVKRRLEHDGLVRYSFDIISLVEDQDYREIFFDELFNHVLRLTS